MQCPPRGASGGAPDPIEEEEGLWDSMGLLGGLQHPWIWGCSACAPVRSCCEMGGQKLKEHVDMGGDGVPPLWGWWFSEWGAWGCFKQSSC